MDNRIVGKHHFKARSKSCKTGGWGGGVAPTERRRRVPCRSVQGHAPLGNFEN